MNPRNGKFLKNNLTNSKFEKMKHIIIMTIIIMIVTQSAFTQTFDTEVTGAQSGTKTYTARNSITFTNGFSYTPSGGTLSATIQNPLVTGDVGYSTFTDPETRSISTSYMVGSANGALSVNLAGAATYQVNIETPPGINGMQPGISLYYNSMSGPGVAGYGWTIGGISAVTRTGKNFFNDGVSSGIKLSTDDRFNLDGQRLILSSGTGAYGANGSKYRAEQDNFTRVTCYADANGPTQFYGEAKNGNKLEYGYVSDADQTVIGTPAVIGWYLNKVTDIYNNTINYSYLKVNGQIYLAEITYGVNTITFSYKTRTDKIVSYVGGLKTAQELLLEKIEIKYNSNVIKKYEFKYNYQGSVNDSYSFLNEVIEYGIGTSRYNSTVFSYNAPSVLSFSQVVSNTTNTDFYNSVLFPGDYNGDGKQDIVSINPSGNAIKLYLATSDGNFSLCTNPATFPNVFKNAQPADLNGDGKADLIITEEYPDGLGTPYYRYSFYISNGTGFTGSYNFPKLKSFSYELTPKGNEQDLPLNDIGDDFNGDGLADLLISNSQNGSWEVHSYTYVNNALVNPALIGSGSINSFVKCYAEDFNGDGNTDLLVFGTSDLKIYYFEQNAFTLKYTFPVITSNHNFNIGDYNGDGKTDIFVYGNQGIQLNEWIIYHSTGAGLAYHYLPSKIPDLTGKNLVSTDFNGDKKTDILIDIFTGSKLKILSSKSLGTDFKLDSVTISNTKFISSDFDGDGRCDIFSTNTAAGYKFHRSPGETGYEMKRISSGTGELTRINYSELTAGTTVYTKGTGATFPVIDMQDAMNVVSSVVYDNGIGGTTTVGYSYEGAKIHRQGRGFLCYTKMKESNGATNLSSESIYDYQTTYYYPRLTTQYKKYQTTTLSTVSNTWSHLTPATGLFVPYVSSSTQTDNLTGLYTTTTVILDNTNGNTTQTQVYYNQYWNKKTEYLYDTNTTYSWTGGRMTSSKDTYSNYGETAIVRETKFTYSTDGKLKPDLVKYLEGTNWYVYKDFNYNTQGNVTQESATATLGGTRLTTYSYDTDNIRVKTVTDPLGHTTTSNYDAYGRMTSQIGFLSDTTSVTYDNMGRISTETNPSKLVKTTTYNWGIATSGLPYSVFNIQVSGNDNSQAKTWFDKLGRAIRTDVKGFNGSDVYTVTEYNAKGQVYRVYEPSTSITPALYTQNSYDNYGRIDFIDRPTIDTDYSYSNNRVTEVNGSRTTWKDYNSLGLVTGANDSGGTIYYNYYPDGAVKTITAPGSVNTRMEYDAAGNQTKLDDPSAGVTTYTYNGYGQMLTSTNNRGQQISVSYHADGRVNTKTMPEGVETWGYKTNKLLETISNSTTNVTRTIGYDAKWRVNQISETIPGSTALSTTFAYDGVGRLQSRTHPSGITETMGYTNGYLSSVSAGGTTRWAATAVNAFGQVTNADYGASLKGEFGYNSYGLATNRKAKVGSTYKQDYRFVIDSTTYNLTSRQDYLRSKSESFTYDTGLDRLLTVTGPQNLTMNYAANGNFTQKSDVGSVYTYGTTGKPYQLTQIETSTGLVSDVEQTVVYTSFEQPATITESPYQALFTYNADGERAKMEVKQSGSTIKARWYAGSRYIKETAGGTTKEFTWIGGDAYSAPCLAVTQSGATTYYYLLRDHLGTITHVTDASGNVVNEYSFDAWGRRRNFTDWSYNVAAQTDILPDRGFTGHEYLPWFKLYNMNGRLYDPVVGRFLEPDPVLQDAFSTQNLNRYSYALNNPLKYVDPNGYKHRLTPYPDEERWIDPDYQNPNGGRGGGNSYSGFGAPGYGNNGTGLNGTYYDWSSNSYRSTSEGNPAVGWGYAYNIASNFGASTNSPMAIEAILGSVVNDGFNFGIHRALGRNHIVIWPYGQKLNVGYASNGGLTSTNGTVFVGGNFAAGQGGGFNWGIPIGAAGTAIFAGTEYADNLVRTSFKTGRNPFSWSKLTPKQQAWRTANVLGKNAKYVKYAKGAGVIGTGISVGMAGRDIYMGDGTTIDYFDVGIGTASIGAAIFLASNPVGWVIGTGAAVYFAGRLVYDIYEEVNY